MAQIAPQTSAANAANRPCDNTLSRPSAMLDSPEVVCSLTIVNSYDKVRVSTERPMVGTPTSPRKENALETHYGVQPDVPPGA